ncbi:MAG: hypothetical protein QXP57_09145 [Nitrososphaerota archaeon]
MHNQLVEFEGSVSLEGPLLESIYAAYLMRMGRELVKAIETRGVQHDILETTHDGFIFYECTGQEVIKENKIHRFLDDILRLDEVLRESYGKGLVKAVFVAAVADDAWQESAKEAMEYVRSKAEQRVGCKVEVISGLNLLKELISSGVLGIRLYQNKIYLTGPEDYGIRYDPERREFRIMTAPIDIARFRETPFSLLPSHYWESYYRELFREMMERKKEEWSNEFNIFSYAFYDGLRLSRTEQLVALYKMYVDSYMKAKCEEFGDSYLFEVFWSRKHMYYRIHVFSADSKIDRNKTKEMRGKAVRLMDEIKSRKGVAEKFSIEFHTLTEDWSSVAWGEVHEVPDKLKDEIYTIGVERGNDLIIRLLNSGVLGFRFKTRNQITLSGLGVDAVRSRYGNIEICPGKVV